YAESTFVSISICSAFDAHSQPAPPSIDRNPMRATPDFDFALGETADMIRETTARFADEQIAPLAAKADAEDWFPRDELWTRMGELGLHGITVEEEFGGLGLGYLEH